MAKSISPSSVDFAAQLLNGFAGEAPISVIVAIKGK
jgi:hypothetical protein